MFRLDKLMRGGIRLSAMAAAAGLYAAVNLSVPVAYAVKAPCEVTGTWTSAWTEDTWRFEQCGTTMSVVRHGGLLGPCFNRYPVGSWYSGPLHDCAYRTSGGPI